MGNVWIPFVALVLGHMAGDILKTDRTAKPYNRLFMEVAYGALTLTGFEYEHLGKVFCFSRALVT